MSDTTKTPEGAIYYENRPDGSVLIRKHTKTTYDPSICERLVEHMATGLSFESFAGVIAISIRTLYEWQKLYPELAQAHDDGVAKCQLQWEKLGLSGTAGKLKGFNSNSWQYNMSNRFKWRSREDITTNDEKIEAAPTVIIDTRPRENVLEHEKGNEIPDKTL